MSTAKEDSSIDPKFASRTTYICWMKRANAKAVRTKYIIVRTKNKRGKEIFFLRINSRIHHFEMFSEPVKLVFHNGSHLKGYTNNRTNTRIQRHLDTMKQQWHENDDDDDDDDVGLKRRLTQIPSRLKKKWKLLNGIETIHLTH